MDRFTSLASRILFLAAALAAVLAVWEGLANRTGFTLSILWGFTPSRLLELAASALLFVIALELRGIKNRVGAPGG